MGFSGTTQFGSNFSVNAVDQDGFASGRLTGFNISPDGVIQGRYTNGQSAVLGQVVIVNFANPQGLEALGDNGFAESGTSGTPLVGTPGTGTLGVLQSSAVEDSNVDLTAELVAMITAQRVYQANAQTIKTQDQVMQTLVNMR
jgi:flagellar hook protein FlgE